MAGEEPRWEQAAKSIRERGPGWLDAERLPWWVFVCLGLVFAGSGLRSALTEDVVWRPVAGIGCVILVAPAQFIAAWRRKRNIPITTPWRLPGRRGR